MRPLATVSIFLLGLLAFASSAHAQPADSTAKSVVATPSPGSPPPLPPARKIPGINAPDEFPNGCVSCHVNLPERHMDQRLSTLMKGWTVKVDPALLAKAQAAAPAAVTLKGKHPAVSAALKDVPAGCVKCHGAASKKAPPFARLIHRIHLVGADENHYMTEFQGECTYCHKLNQATGAWSVASAPEP
ncbi:MAG: hypothetical protein ACM3PF_02745 [Bacteroidota bacterium]